jgi:hypothetical protein
MPEVNFDIDADEAFEEIKNIELKIFEKLLANADITEQIFPILFPQKRTLAKLKEYFDTKRRPAYNELSKKIQRYISNNYIVDDGEMLMVADEAGYKTKR